LLPRHGAVLAFIEPDGTRASELSERSGQHKQVIGTLVDELQQWGFGVFKQVFTELTEPRPASPPA
jgi:hypothetical protein